MKRFFFDVWCKTHTEYDYQGRDFAQPQHAHEWAELLALDLGCSNDGGWAGAEVQVRDAIGSVLLAVPIQNSELIAA